MKTIRTPSPMPASAPQPDFTVCPHCWHLNPASRFCARCLSDMTMLLQESGGLRWTAPMQSPVPIRVRGRLSRRQRWVLLGILVLFGMGQLAVALAPRAGVQESGERVNG